MMNITDCRERWYIGTVHRHMNDIVNDKYLEAGEKLRKLEGYWEAVISATTLLDYDYEDIKYTRLFNHYIRLWDMLFNEVY